MGRGVFWVSSKPTGIQWFELERLIALSAVVTIDLSFVVLRDIRLGPLRQTRNLESGPIGRLEIESATHGILLEINRSNRRSWIGLPRPCAHRAEYSPGAQREKQK